MKTPLKALAIALAFLCTANNFAGGQDPKPAAKNLLKKTNDADSWRFELHDAAEGKIAVDKEAIVLSADATTGTNWHIQAYQTELALKENATYTVSLKIRAPVRRSVLLIASVDEEDYHEIGLHEEIYATSDFKEHRFTFRTTDVADKKNRIGFMLGDEKGIVQVRDLVMVEGKKK